MTSYRAMFGIPSRKRIRSMILSACFISPIDSSCIFFASVSKPQFFSIFAWTKYWLIAVSSVVSARFSASMTLESPFMRSPYSGFRRILVTGGRMRQRNRDGGNAMILTRREFLAQTAIGAVALAQDAPSLEHTIATISGTPRERGRQYGAKFKDAIRAFLNKEIYASFVGKPNAKEAILRFAGGCTKAVKEYSPLIFDEMEGMAEGTGLTIEETVLITNHEELWHRGVIPAQDHCTVFGAAPPDTKDGDTFVCQTWD